MKENIIPFSIFCSFFWLVGMLIWTVSIFATEWDTTKTRIYNPKFIWMEINSHFMNSSDDTKWIEWFKKNNQWNLEYTFINYTKWEAIPLNIVPSNEIMTENNLPYGVYKTAIKCVKIPPILSVLFLIPWAKTCSVEQRDFIINTKYFINNK